MYVVFYIRPEYRNGMEMLFNFANINIKPKWRLFESANVFEWMNKKRNGPKFYYRRMPNIDIIECCIFVFWFFVTLYCIVLYVVVRFSVHFYSASLRIFLIFLFRTIENEANIIHIEYLLTINGPKSWFHVKHFVCECENGARPISFM